jgi:excisionase family DNA binding protein
VTADRLLTVRDVADHLRVSESTVKHLARTGDLASFRVGKLYRFTQAMVDQYLTGTATPAGQAIAAVSEPVLLSDEPMPVGFEPVGAVLAREAAR